MTSGCYFISTSDPLGKLIQWSLGLNYNVIGVNIETTLPGISSFKIYFIDLRTLGPPTWASQPVSYDQWSKPDVIDRISFRQVIEFGREQESFRTVVAKWITKYWIPNQQRSNDSTNHWMSIVSGLWHPNKDFPWISNYEYEPEHVLMSKILYYDETSTFIQLLMNQHPHLSGGDDSFRRSIQDKTQMILELFKTKSISPTQWKDYWTYLIPKEDHLIPKDMICLHEDPVIKIHEQIKNWVSAINNKSTVVIELNDMLTQIQKMNILTDLPNTISGHTSFPAVVIVHPNPGQIVVPGLSETDTIPISLEYPDLSILSNEQIKKLNETLHLAEYFDNPRFDKLRKMCLKQLSHN